MRKYVLTGGHCVGKSSLLLALEQQGEHVVSEAASSIQYVDRARGRVFSDDADDFESRVLALHLAREGQIPPMANRVFLDRGAPDHLAYARIGRWPLSPDEVAACLSSRYDLAFLVEPSPGRPPVLSRPDAGFAARLVSALEGIYREIGVPIVKLPYAPIEDRVALVLSTADAGTTVGGPGTAAEGTSS